jgi:Domain of unknown function (DUF4062)
MDKRFQVFVSSTYDDLREARQEVMQALLELDCIPAGMELFPAANEDQWTLIKGVIDDCDYYIVVVGGRYGSIGAGGRSYTEMEYEYAISQHKPVIGFLHKDPGTLPANKCEKTPDARAKLETFRNRVQQKMCRFWTTPADLGSVVSRSLVKLIKNNPAIGWVRADLLPDQSSAEEILKLRNQIESLQDQLQQTGSQSPSGTEHLAQGDDRIVLNFTFGAYGQKSSYRPEATYSSTFTPSWNELFAAVSPLLIDEASDRVVKEAFDQFVHEQSMDQLLKDKDLKNYELKGFSLDKDDFNTIKVQFLALRLIAKSSKKKARSVSDRNAYWMLTPYGESVMTSLRAIKRKGSGDKRQSRRRKS